MVKPRRISDFKPTFTNLAQTSHYQLIFGGLPLGVRQHLNVRGVDYRFMTENGTVLIHQISTNFWGKFEDLKDECHNTTELMKIVKRIYSCHTTMKKKHLDQIIKRELLLTYSECVKYGIVSC